MKGTYEISCDGRCGHTNCPNCGCHAAQTPLDFSGAGCGLYLDHKLAWAGDGFFCSRCMCEFVPRAEKEKSKEEAQSSAYERVIEVLEGMREQQKNIAQNDYGNPYWNLRQDGFIVALSEAISKIKELKGKI